MVEKPPRFPRDAFDEAAKKCGVTRGEFKLWLIEHIKVGPDRWSKWESGKEAIPEKHLVAFLRARLLTVSGPPRAAPSKGAGGV